MRESSLRRRNFLSFFFPFSFRYYYYEAIVPKSQGQRRKTKWQRTLRPTPLFLRYGVLWISNWGWLLPPNFSVCFQHSTRRWFALYFILLFLFIVLAAFILICCSRRTPAWELKRRSEPLKQCMTNTFTKKRRDNERSTSLFGHYCFFVFSF